MQELLSRFAALGALREHDPSDPIVQEKISDLQSFISSCYYHCTNEILKSLGELYVCDERMTRNIDQAGGVGTAAFVKAAIDIYCA